MVNKNIDFFSTEVTGGHWGQERSRNQLCWILMKIVLNDRYIILVYDNIIMLGVRGWLEVDWGRFWKMVEFYFFKKAWLFLTLNVTFSLKYV